MERDDYWLLLKGYFNKTLKDYRLLRWAVTPIVSAWTDKFNPFTNMPLDGDEELRRIIRDDNQKKKLKIDDRNLETLRKFREAEANQKSKEN